MAEAKPEKLIFNYINSVGEANFNPGMSENVFIAKLAEALFDQASVGDTDFSPSDHAAKVDDDSPITNPKLIGNQSAVLKWLKKIPIEDFLLAFTVSLFNFGEKRFVTNVYSAICDDFIPKDETDDIRGETEQAKDKRKVHATTRRKVEDVFGKGFRFSLNKVGADIDTLVLTDYRSNYELEIVKFNNPKFNKTLWSIWLDQWPNLLDQVTPTLMHMLTNPGNLDQLTQVVSSRALGELYCRNFRAAVGEFLWTLGDASDRRIRYNLGYILGIILKNSPGELNNIYNLLIDWNRNDWRTRWTAASSCSRIHQFDLKRSLRLIHQIAQTTDEISRLRIRQGFYQDAYLETQPFNMVCHSIIYIFSSSYVEEVFDLLNDWQGLDRRNSALPAISRELYIDLMLNHFDLRKSGLFSEENMSSKNNVDSNKTTENTVSDTASSKEDAKEVAAESQKPAGNRILESRGPGDEIDLGSDNESINEAEQTDGIQSPLDENKPPDESVADSNVGDDVAGHPVEDEQDVITRILHVDDPYKKMWSIVEMECKASNYDYSGKFTKMLVGFILETMRTSRTGSDANKYFPPAKRKPPYISQLLIVRNWILLTRESAFDFIADPLYVVLMAAYVELGIVSPFLQEKRYYFTLKKWFNDPNDALHNDSFLKEILNAIEHIMKN